MKYLAFSFTAALFAAGCQQTLGAGPCESARPAAACSQACSTVDANTCPAGYHCGPANTCYAACTQGGSECGAGMTCSAEGRCQATSGADASTADSDNSCASVNFTAKPVIPSIQLVLDRSGSMGNEFGNTSRWEALKAALISPTDGVVTQLQARAYFGVTLYPNPNGTCSFDQTPRALNAASQIQTELDSQGPGGGTPTGDALAQATLAFSGNNAPPADSPAIIVLATDGEPNGCAGGNYDGREGVLEAVRAAYAKNIRVLPLAMALNNSGIAHLQDVANIGSGVQAGQPNAPVYKGDSPAELRAAFDTIIGGVVSCQLDLSGNIVVEQASNGTVRLNGRALTFGTDWRAVDMNTIELLGAACTELKSAPNPTVAASFPCGAVIE